MGAGGAVLAHDNGYNRWVAGPAAAYFTDEESCRELLDQLLADEGRTRAMKMGSLERFKARFTWPIVLGEYEQLLEHWHA
jgi:glycosyltransferase involved in cell wall biosynthesis